MTILRAVCTIRSLDRRNPEWTGAPVTFGDLYPFDRARPVAGALQAVVKLLQVPLRLGRKPFDALAIHPRRPLVPRNLLPRGAQGRRADDLIHQAEPLASFDAVIQRRHHALGPDRGFRPSPGWVESVCPLLSRSRHCRDSLCHYPHLAPPTPCHPSLGMVLLATPLAAPRQRCRVGGGAFETSHAGLRPPLKLGVRFSRTQLSRRRSSLSGDGRDHRNQVHKPVLAVELSGWQRFPTATAPLAVPVRPDPPHQPAVEPVEELSDVSPLVVLAPTAEHGIDLLYQLASGHGGGPAGEPTNLVLELVYRFLSRISIRRSP